MCIVGRKLSMKPIIVLSNAEQQCATFFWRENPQFYVGYRFIEHEPDVLPTPLPGIDLLPAALGVVPPTSDKPALSGKEGDPWNNDWKVRHVDDHSGNGTQLSFATFSDGAALCRSAGNVSGQIREFFFEPVDDGVCLWMKLTSRAAIMGAFCVQQCLRFTGSSNVEWRRRVALVPFLSEFDIQARGKPLETITFARRGNQWLRFPLSHTRYHTAPGFALVAGKSEGEVDHGLIVRESLDSKYCSGMYWERTAYISNRHPADCVHASVDLGPLDPGGSRLARGKVYFITGTKDDLLELWKKDFPCVDK